MTKKPFCSIIGSHQLRGMVRKKDFNKVAFSRYTSHRFLVNKNHEGVWVKMKKERKKEIVKNVLFGIAYVSVLAFLVFQIWSLTTSHHGGYIYYKHSSANYEAETSVPAFTIDFELQPLTIQEDETYQITNFFPTDQVSLLTNVQYQYKDERMGNYSIPGTYEIAITFQDTYGRVIEKDATLVIEKKVVSVPVSQKVYTQEKATKSTSTTSTEKQIIDDAKTLGTQGRLYIASSSVALYSPTTSEEAQEMVDQQDSGAFYRYGNTMIIADHDYQGFSIIKSLKTGNFVYIKKRLANGNILLEKYIVDEKTTGFNTKTNLVTEDGRDIGTDIAADLSLYTCNSSDGYHITLVFLHQV